MKLGEVVGQDLKIVVRTTTPGVTSPWKTGWGVGIHWSKKIL